MFDPEMKIRKANQKDAGAIDALLEQLGYTGTQTFLAKRINLLESDSSEELVVGEENGRVVAVLSFSTFDRDTRKPQST
jgi:N-acetylglutamate synthase-like GNAT family acetyltransferase